VAVVLSFFWCGLGQIYNGQIAKGLLFLFVQVVNIPLMFVGIGFFTAPLLWLWSMVDAYNTAETFNRRLY
jgi:TM2 domain-containing membrane protein YozV